MDEIPYLLRHLLILLQSIVSSRIQSQIILIIIHEIIRMRIKIRNRIRSRLHDQRLKQEIRCRSLRRFTSAGEISFPAPVTIGRIDPRPIPPVHRLFHILIQYRFPAGQCYGSFAHTPCIMNDRIFPPHGLNRLAIRIINRIIIVILHICTVILQFIVPGNILQILKFRIIQQRHFPSILIRHHRQTRPLLAIPETLVTYIHSRETRTVRISQHMIRIHGIHKGRIPLYNIAMEGKVITCRNKSAVPNT